MQWQQRTQRIRKTQRNLQALTLNLQNGNLLMVCSVLVMLECLLNIFYNRLYWLIINHSCNLLSLTALYCHTWDILCNSDLALNRHTILVLRISVIILLYVRFCSLFFPVTVFITFYCVVMVGSFVEGYNHFCNTVKNKKLCIVIYHYFIYWL